MATYTTLRNGSSGSEVKKLQQTLKDAGYNIGSAGVDGIYGNQTAAAVKAYQKANGLAVDGIAGNQTLGKLYAKTTAPSTTTTPTTTAKPSTTPKDFKYDDFKVSDETATSDKKRQELESQKPSDFTYADYEKSDVVKQAEAMLQQQIANKPGEYQSNWQTQLDETLNKILNREKFTYDLNGDALYQQYKDQYMLQGQQAMIDTMGQAQAMTGGYGNSYAQSVGQQTYQGYLQQLNDKVPELYQLALDQYNREGQDLYNQYGLYADRENQDYGRYRDAVSDYRSDLDYLTNEARYQSETDYGKYMDKYNMSYGQHRDEVADWQNELNRADSEYWNQYGKDYGQYTDDKNFAYGQYSDKIANEWKQKEFDEALRQYNEQMAYQKERDAVADSQWQKEYSLAASKVSSGGGSSGSGSGGGSSDVDLKHVGTMTADEIVNTMAGFKADNDNTGLANFLDYCVAAGMMTETMADEYFKKYRTGEDSAVDTTVDKLTVQEKRLHGGSGGKFREHQVR